LDGQRRLQRKMEQEYGRTAMSYVGDGGEPVRSEDANYYS
jgi:hypothetical protein